MLKSQCHGTNKKMGSFGSSRFMRRNPQILDLHFQIWLTSVHVAKFGWVPFGDRATMLAMKKVMIAHTRGKKYQCRGTFIVQNLTIN